MKKELAVGIIGTITVFVFAAYIGMKYERETATSLSSPENRISAKTAGNGATQDTALTLQEVSRHNTAADCWEVFSGKVYALSSYLSAHPGGAAEIIKFCGTDATAAYDTKDGQGRPHSARANQDLSNYYIGDLNSSINAEKINAAAQNAAAAPANRGENEYEENSKLAYRGQAPVKKGQAAAQNAIAPEKKREPVNREEYDRLLVENANAGFCADTATGTAKKIAPLWPVSAPYPLEGAILPYHRIVAYYGNFLSKSMGALGKWPEEEMLSRLDAEVKKWEKADPRTPVIPALHYIDVTAQGSPGKDGKYRLRMPDDQIDYALKLADKINGIVFLDIQVGLSSLPQEIPLLEKYLKMPNVHLGIDAEFSMKTGAKPGTVVGTFNASDINYAAEYLAKLVRENNLPPKVLVVHRYTQDMITGYKRIKPLPEVQIVMHMDGWGDPEKKFGTYNRVIYPEPVQFTGFKLFYVNDLWEPSREMLSPEELLTLKPQPLYIQYQ